MDEKTIHQSLRQYIKSVQKQVKVNKVILFGSLAQGKKTANDVDVIILSEDFKTLDPDERSRLLYRASVGFPYDLHVYGFTSRELNSASPLTALSKLKQTKTITFN